VAREKVTIETRESLSETRWPPAIAEPRLSRLSVASRLRERNSGVFLHGLP
jgi:hypothetical protein